MGSAGAGLLGKVVALQIVSCEPSGSLQKPQSPRTSSGDYEELPVNTNTITFPHRANVWRMSMTNRPTIFTMEI